MRSTSRFFCVASLAVILALAVAVQAANLPDFTHLAEQSGKAVVNITTVKTVKGSDRMRDFMRQHPRGPGGNNPFEDFFDQFDKFFNNNPRGEKQRSLGSGFLLSPDGYIVTNNHVIADTDEIKINLQGRGDSYDAKIVGRDQETDLALIKIEAKDPLPFLEFGDSDNLKVGEWLLAIGNPFGLGHSVTAGILSAKGRIIGAGAFDDFLQTDASINPGNSGGPLLNMDGRVVGINTAIIASGQGIGFAVPAKLAKGVVDQLRESKNVQRGWLGVSIQDLDANSAKALGLPEAKGAMISSVMPGEPADKAGIKTSDVVLKVNGEAVDDASGLLKRIARIKPGEKANLTVWRGGKTKDVAVTLGQRDLDKMTAGKGGKPGPSQKEETTSALGLSVRPMTSQEAKALKLDSARGLLVEDVETGSRAEDADVRPGDVILEANQQEVATADAFKKIVNGASDRGLVMLLLKRQGQNLFRTVPLEPKK